MKKDVLCLVLLIGCAIPMLAQHDIVVNNVGKKTTHSLSEIEYIDFKNGNETITVDFANVTVLSDVIRFKLVFSEDVEGYYLYTDTYDNYVKYNNTHSDSEKHWTDILKKSKFRYTDKNVFNIRGCQPNSENIIFVLAADKDGNFGPIVTKVIKTPKAESQPMAAISKFEHSPNLLQWETTKTNNAASYYMIVNTSDSALFDGKDDIVVAYHINKYKDTLPIWTEFNSFKVSLSKADDCMEIVTWAMDAKGNMSGSISRQAIMPSNKSPKKKKGYEVKTLPYPQMTGRAPSTLEVTEAVDE